jgi:hypothetical protein
MSTEPNPYHPPSMAPLAELPLKPAFNWRRIWWAIGIWLVILGGIYGLLGLIRLGVMGPANSVAGHWAGIIMIFLALLFLIYNIVVLILVFTAFFRKNLLRR